VSAALAAYAEAIQTMSTGPSDAEHYNDRQRQQWDRVAAGWEKWWRTIEDGAQHVNDRLVDLAEVAPGKRVLDIATGIGEPALSAAIRVGSTGRVVGIDISKQMLDIARTRASAAGLTNVEFLEADADRLEFPDHSFDAVLCRWGISSLPNYSNLLVKIKRMLAPNGSFATSVWDEASRLPLTSIAITIAQEMFHSEPPVPEPPPEVPEDALESVMIRAGFDDVRAEKLTVTLDLASTEAFTRYLVDVSPVIAALLSDQPPMRQKEYHHLLARAFGRYAAVDGSFRVHNVSICAVGRK
jgi:ubiquinone/menaquinone biosynthesis C-methylase UbiE